MLDPANNIGPDNQPGYDDYVEKDPIEFVEEATADLNRAILQNNFVEFQEILNRIINGVPFKNYLNYMFEFEPYPLLVAAQVNDDKFYNLLIRYGKTKNIGSVGSTYKRV